MFLHKILSFNLYGIHANSYPFVVTKCGDGFVYSYANEPWPLEFGSTIASHNFLKDTDIHFVGTSGIRILEFLSVVQLIILNQRLLRADSTWKSFQKQLNFSSMENITASSRLIFQRLSKLHSQHTSKIHLTDPKLLFDWLEQYETSNNLSVPSLSMTVVDHNPDVKVFWDTLQSTTIFSSLSKDCVTSSQYLNLRFLERFIQFHYKTLPLYVSSHTWQHEYNKTNNTTSSEWLKLSGDLLPAIREDLTENPLLFSYSPELFFLADKSFRCVSSVVSDINDFLLKSTPHKKEKKHTLILYLSNISDHQNTYDFNRTASLLNSLKGKNTLFITASHRHQMTVRPSSSSSERNLKRFQELFLTLKNLLNRTFQIDFSNSLDKNILRLPSLLSRTCDR